jgi:hypothetical protein
VLERAQELYAKSNQNWQAFQATAKLGVDQSLLDDLGARYTAIIKDGVEPEFARRVRATWPRTTRSPTPRSARCSSRSTRPPPP